MDALPVLLPYSSLPPAETTARTGWRPTRYAEKPKPPPVDEHRAEVAAATEKNLLDAKALKKTRPRRTVDVGGAMGRWAQFRRCRPSPYYVPQIRPAPPFIIDLLPPAAYPRDPSTSLTTKFIHTSTNKIRCPVNCIAWTPEGRRLLTGSSSGEFTLWNGLTFNFETILQAHDAAVRALTFSRSGAYLASADQTGIIKYFQPNMNNLTAWQAHREAVREITFSPDDRRFATGSDDSTVRLWDFEESREERVLSGHGWDVRCVQWHPTKGLIVSGSKDNLVKFWDPRTGTCLSTLHHHKNTIQALAWSPSGDLVATASRDQTVRLFDIRALKEFRVFKGHKKDVCSVAWHPVHPILTSGGSEGSILFWDVDTPDPPPPTSFAPTQIPGGPRATMEQAHDSNVWSLAYHPLGHILASASNDHTTRFWARERPGDASSNFSGGFRPPESGADEDDDQDDEDSMALPGFAFLGQNQNAATNGTQSNPNGGSNVAWWGPGNEPALPGLGSSAPAGGGEGIPGIPGLGQAPSQASATTPVSFEHRQQDSRDYDDGYGSRGNGQGGYGRDRDRDRDRGGYGNSGYSRGGERGGGGGRGRWQRRGGPRY